MFYASSSAVNAIPTSFAEILFTSGTLSLTDFREAFFANCLPLVLAFIHIYCLRETCRGILRMLLVSFVIILSFFRTLGALSVFVWLLRDIILFLWLLGSWVWALPLVNSWHLTFVIFVRNGWIRHVLMYVQLIITAFAKVQIAVKTEHIHALVGATGLSLLICLLAIGRSGINGFGISVWLLAFAALEHVFYTFPILIMTLLRMHGVSMRKERKV